MAIAKQNLSLSLLGPFVLDGEASPSLPRRAQALPALLALQKGRPLTREMVADLLWTHSGPEQVRHSLRQSLVVLRRTLGGTVIRAEAELLAVPAEAIAVDVVEFEALASSNGLGDLSRCAELYQGELLQNIGSVSARFDEWLEIERKRLIGLAATVFRRLSEARAAAGDFGGALAAGRRLVGLDDLNEEAHRWLIRLLTKSGRCAEALRQYETCAETLKRELGITPEASTIELMHSIRSGAAAETAPLARPTMADTVLPDADRRQIAALRVSSLKLGGKTWVRIVGALAFACVVAAGVGAMTIKPRAVLPSLTLVVAPFVNNAGVDGQDLAIAGIADVIVAELRETHSLRVAQYREDDVVPVHDRVAADPAARFVVEDPHPFHRRSMSMSASSIETALHCGQSIMTCPGVTCLIWRAISRRMSRGPWRAIPRCSALINRRSRNPSGPRANCWLWRRTSVFAYPRCRLRHSGGSSEGLSNITRMTPKRWLFLAMVTLTNSA